MNSAIPPSKPARIAIIGGGPAGLFAAEQLAGAGHAVEVFDRMPSLGRKFLMAGRGGLNLTHAEPLEFFLKRYQPVAPVVEKAIRAFPPEALRAWADGLGQETFAGTSGRVFPKAMKASPLLRAWLGRLNELGVMVHLRHTFEGWSADGGLLFSTPAGEAVHTADAVVLALGGASWPRLGSDGGWAGWLGTETPVTPLRATNAGVLIAWSDILRERHAGTPLKRIAIRIGERTERGEAIITQTGLEGGVIYALSRDIRAALDRDGYADITLNLRPDTHPDEIVQRLGKTNRKESFSSRLRKAAGIQPNAVALVHEVTMRNGKGPPKDDYAAMARLVTGIRLRVTGIAGLDRAISTAGGVAFEGLSEDFMLKSRPGVFVAGEMLDWEAPTGGYLLQACFSTGMAAAEGVKRYLARVIPDRA
ncbi:MAG: hypothetical protein FD175_2991 [Beijerinckiaceae bacterium]|nr:MAG: hypothetical protein FD175_2991 [Beijerinckiaceae bacterium]